MKTKITVFLMIVISIMLVGTINVEAYNHASAGSAEKLAEILEATHNGNEVTLQKDVNLIDEEYREPMRLDIWADDIILDLNGFSIRGVEIKLWSDLHMRNGTFYDSRISYWKTLTIENATVRGLDGQAESFTNIKGTSTLSGITLGNTTIEKDATLVVDERNFEFGYHDYNENGHLLTNNGTILIKDENSKFKIEQGNTLINNGNIENNGTYINEWKTKYGIIIEKSDGCDITSNLTIAEEGEEIQLTTKSKEGYILKEIKVYKVNDKNEVVEIENNSFTMPDYAVVVEAIVEQEQNNFVEEENNQVLLDKKDETPKMGSATIDNIGLFIGLIIISLIGIVNTKNQIKRKETTN